MLNIPNINKKFSDKIIDRAPKKMVDCMQGNVLLAYQQALFYADVNKYLD